MKKFAIATIAAAALLATATAEARCNGCGGGTYNYNYTGMQRGSGPYDSAIAQTGIAAAAGLIGKLIDANRPQQPIVINQMPPGYGRGYGATTDVIMSPRCTTAVYGYDLRGKPLYGNLCR